MSQDFHVRDESARRHFLRDRGWIVALALIAIGVILLLQNLGLAVPHNWWAVFLLIPAIAAFASTLRTYNRERRITTASLGPFIGGIGLVVLAVIFLLDLEIWNYVGPIALILIGLGILARYFRRG